MSYRQNAPSCDRLSAIHVLFTFRIYVHIFITISKSFSCYFETNTLLIWINVNFISIQD